MLELGTVGVGPNPERMPASKAGSAALFSGTIAIGSVHQRAALRATSLAAAVLRVALILTRPAR